MNWYSRNKGVKNGDYLYGDKVVCLKVHNKDDECGGEKIRVFQKIFEVQKYRR